ncbi:unnamed protein product [Closterium sp. NIES-64]|nr:unnamed protein product [Closterium sp. NIES-64]
MEATSSGTANLMDDFFSVPVTSTFSTSTSTTAATAAADTSTDLTSSGWISISPAATTATTATAATASAGGIAAGFDPFGPASLSASGAGPTGQVDPFSSGFTDPFASSTNPFAEPAPGPGSAALGPAAEADLVGLVGGLSMGANGMGPGSGAAAGTTTGGRAAAIAGTVATGAPAAAAGMGGSQPGGWESFGAFDDGGFQTSSSTSSGAANTASNHPFGAASGADSSTQPGGWESFDTSTTFSGTNASGITASSSSSQPGGWMSFDASATNSAETAAAVTAPAAAPAAAAAAAAPEATATAVATPSTAVDLEWASFNPPAASQPAAATWHPLMASEADSPSSPPHSPEALNQREQQQGSSVSDSQQALRQQQESYTGVTFENSQTGGVFDSLQGNGGGSQGRGGVGSHVTGTGAGVRLGEREGEAGRGGAEGAREEREGENEEEVVERIVRIAQGVSEDVCEQWGAAAFGQLLRKVLVPKKAIDFPTAMELEIARLRLSLSASQRDSILSALLSPPLSLSSTSSLSSPSPHVPPTPLLDPNRHVSTPDALLCRQLAASLASACLTAREDAEIGAMGFRARGGEGDGCEWGVGGEGRGNERVGEEGIRNGSNGRGEVEQECDWWRRNGLLAGLGDERVEGEGEGDERGESDEGQVREEAGKGNPSNLGKATLCAHIWAPRGQYTASAGGWKLPGSSSSSSSAGGFGGGGGSGGGAGGGVGGEGIGGGGATEGPGRPGPLDAPICRECCPPAVSNAVLLHRVRQLQARRRCDRLGRAVAEARDWGCAGLDRRRSSGREDFRGEKGEERDGDEWHQAPVVPVMSRGGYGGESGAAEMSLAELPHAGLLFSVRAGVEAGVGGIGVPSDTSAAPANSLLLPPSSPAPLSSVWRAPSDLTAVEIAIVLSAPALVSRIVLHSGLPQYTPHHTPKVRISLSTTIDQSERTTIGLWDLPSTAAAARSDTKSNPKSELLLSYTLPAAAAPCRIIWLKFLLPEVRQPGTPASCIWARRIRVYGQKTFGDPTGIDPATSGGAAAVPMGAVVGGAPGAPVGTMGPAGVSAAAAAAAAGAAGAAGAVGAAAGGTSRWEYQQFLEAPAPMSRSRVREQLYVTVVNCATAESAVGRGADSGRWEYQQFLEAPAPMTRSRTPVEGERVWAGGRILELLLPVSSPPISGIRLDALPLDRSTGMSLSLPGAADGSPLARAARGGLMDEWAAFVVPFRLRVSARQDSFGPATLLSAAAAAADMDVSLGPLSLAGRVRAYRYAPAGDMAGWSQLAGV